MQTTIVTRIHDRPRNEKIIDLTNLVLNLLLVVSYLAVVILLVSTPVRHGYGGGMGGGMGSALNLVQPAFLILFSMLFFFHMVSLFKNRLPVQVIIITGVGTIISGSMIISLFLFVRQSANLLNSVHPVPQIVFISLAASLVLGILVVIQQIRHGTIPKRSNNGRSGPSFPLPRDRYRNARILAQGGVGTIWYAERNDDDLPVIVKIPLRYDERTGMSFMQEISVWKDLEHPNIATILSANILPAPYIEVEYLPGSLEEVEKPIPLHKAVRIMKDLVSALVYAHGRGVAHCDIKPSNILLTSNGVPKLTDWGLAWSGSSRWAVLGYSPRYAAPEQHLKNPECGFTTDIWQIGMVFAELLTGRTGIPSGTEPVFLQGDGAVLLPILQKCLSPGPPDRYPSAQLLQEELNIRFPA